MNTENLLKLADSLEEISNLFAEYFSQDNCGTAYPVYWVIRDVDWQPVYHFCDAESYVAIYDTEEINRADTLPELYQKLKSEDHDYVRFPKEFDYEDGGEWQLSELSEANEGLLDIYGQKKGYKDRSMFLFQSEAEEHLRANAHHYSNEAHIYCKYAWRAPKTEQFLTPLPTGNAGAVMRELVVALQNVVNGQHEFGTLRTRESRMIEVAETAMKKAAEKIGKENA